MFEVIVSGLDALIGQSPALADLQLFGFPLGRLPGALRELRELRSLRLAATFPGTLPDQVFDLPRLEYLDLGFNQLSALPATLAPAGTLRRLSLRMNGFSSVPPAVWELRQLQVLDLRGCPIREIGPDVLRLEQLERLELAGNERNVPAELVSPPPEIAAQGLEAIKNYWRQEQEAGVDYLAEAKLLIVGEPGAGKTTLTKKILDPGYQLDAAEVSTEGIDVSTWQFDSAIRTRGGNETLHQCGFRAHIWDFGGQEIYHATHQFFLTKRSVYLLVTDERKENTDFEYWLEIVNLLSDGSPVIVVRNRKQGRDQRVDLGGLRQRYPNLWGSLTVDLADNAGLDDAVRTFRAQLEQLPHIGVPLPKTWRDVRVALEAEARDHIPAEEFFAICADHGFTRREDMEQLGGYLHDLGICLFFQDDDLLGKTVILKPEWGTGAVYRVLDDPGISEALGVFTPEDLRRIWHEPAYASMRAELLQLMMRFGLCYRVPGSETYAAPQLLSPTRPAYAWDGTDNLELRYEYDVMPKGIVQRLIVDLHDLIVPENTVWRSGVLLAYDASRAEVIEDYRRRRLTVRVRGGDPRVLLGLVNHALQVIHRSYPRIRVERYRPCDCPGCQGGPEPSLFSIRDLQDFAATGDKIQCRVSRKLRDPRALLLGTFLDVPMPLAFAGGADTRPSPPVQPEVFVSYHWGGAAEGVVEQLVERLAARGVLITRDRDEVRYRDSIEQFMRRLGAGKAVVVVLDKAYLESRNCMFELTQLAARPEFANRIFPVLLPDAGVVDPLTRLRYVKFWERKRDELKAEMRDVEPEFLHGIREELDLYETIRNTIAQIMQVLADMNTLTLDQHRDADFEQLHRALDAALA